MRGAQLMVWDIGLKVNKGVWDSEFQVDSQTLNTKLNPDSRAVGLA